MSATGVDVGANKDITYLKQLFILININYYY